MSKTTEILVTVTRQYWHNHRGGGQVPGFDYDETCKIVSTLERTIKELKMERTAMIAAKEAHQRQVEGLEEGNSKLKEEMDQIEGTSIYGWAQAQLIEMDVKREQAQQEPGTNPEHIGCARDCNCD